MAKRQISNYVPKSSASASSATLAREEIKNILLQVSDILNPFPSFAIIMSPQSVLS